MTFTLQNFDSIASGNNIKEVENKFKILVDNVSKKINYHSGIYKNLSAFFSKSKDRKVFFNLQINSEDLSLEFHIENKEIILKFINNVKVETLQKLKKLGDCEIAIWDGEKKVCKLYPDYIDNRTLRFLSDKLKDTKRPVFKFRKIYSREKTILRSPKLIDDIVKSMKKMEFLFNYA